MKFREITAIAITPILRATGFRFNKDWRVNEFGFKAFVFRNILNTTGANIRANG